MNVKSVRQIITKRGGLKVNRNYVIKVMVGLIPIQLWTSLKINVLDNIHSTKIMTVE